MRLPENALLLLCAAMFVLVGCGPAGPRAVLKGERLIREQKYALAVQQLQEAIRLIPTNAQAWNHLGLALHHNKHPKEALKAYRQALALDRKLSIVHYNIGCLLLEQNDPTGAMDPLTSYTYLQPRSTAGWIMLGRAQLRARRFDAAETSFKRALNLDPNDPEAANNLGVAQANRRRPFEALASFSQALRHDPRRAPALLNASIVTYQQLNNPGMALQKLRQYTALKPQPVHMAAVTSFENRLNLELNPPKPMAEARTPASPVAVATTSPSRIVPQTNTQQFPAIAELSPALTNPPPRVDLTASAPANTASQRGIPERVTVQTNLTIAAAAKPPLPTGANSTSPSQPGGMSDTRLAPVRTDATNQLLSDSRVTRPPTQTVAALVHQIPRKAAEVEVTRLSDDIVVSPVQDVSPTPRTAPARSPAVAPEERAPASPSGVEKRPLIARLNPFNRNPQPSTPTATTNTRSAPHSRYTYTRPRPGRAGNRAEASRALAEGVKAHQSGRLSQALASYERAVQLDPAYFEGQYNLGLALYESGNARRALAVFENALALRPDSVDARYNFALALKQADFFYDGAEQLEQILRTSDDTRAHLSLANLYAQKLNQPTLARLHYRRVLEKDPHHPQAADIRFWLAANSRG